MSTEMSPPVGRPDTRYVESPHGYIGHQVFGAESPDIVFVTGWVTNHRLVRLQIDRFQGREVKPTGDGFVAMFAGPMRAIQCARVMVSELKKIGLRVGIHTGRSRSATTTSAVWP